MSDAIAPVAPTATAPVGEQTPAVADVAKAAPEKDQFAEKLELLARKERALYKEKQKIAYERKQSQEALGKVKAWEDSRTSAKKNPLDYLSQAGLSYDELTNFMLNGGKPTEADRIEAVRDEFGQFKKQIEEEKLKAQQAQAQAQQQMEQEAVNGLKEDIKSVIEKGAETYELLATRGAEEEVFNHLRDSFRMEFQAWTKAGRKGPPPQPMSPEKAAQEMEEFYEKEMDRLIQTKKMQARQQPQSKDAGLKKGPSPTLSNAMTSSAAASLIPAKNDEDRMQRALAKL